jgi:hypothetical protein
MARLTDVFGVRAVAGYDAGHGSSTTVSGTVFPSRV